jgi:TonB-linked SusC/RagA family outer membrane protein
MRLFNKLTVLALVAITFGASAQDEITRVSKQYPGAVSISGIVTEAATGKVLRGINVSYKDYSAAITDSLGAFTLRVPSYDVAILMEGEGFQSKEIALRGKKVVHAALYEDTYISVYDETVQPFGTAMKNKVAFSTSSLQTQGNWGRITETPSSYLQGRMAGLNATRRSGTPNIGAVLFLRGINSLYASNRPLIVVDGILFNNEDHGGSIISNHYTDPLSTIDVRDIDNISIIKDGTSLYGVKGSNGVILITTARARELGTRIDFGAYTGINFAPTNLPVMQAGDYRLYLSDILQSKGLSNAEIQALPYMNDDVNNPDYYRYHNNTNWQDQVFNKSYTKNIFLKVTGGDNIARYALSLGFMGNDGVTRNTDMTRYNMRFNGDLNLSRKLTATTNLSFTFNEQNLRDQGGLPKTNPILLALLKAPILRVKDVSEKGIESPTLADRDTFNMGNPVVLANVAQGVNKSYRFLGSIGFNYQLNRWFTISTTVGVTNDKVRENFFIPRKGVTTDTLPTDIAYSRLGTQVVSYFSLYNDTRVAFARRFNGVHELSARAGVRYLYSKSEQDFGFGFNSAIDELVSVGNGAASLRRVGGVAGESNWVNNYLSADYSLSDKYLVSFNLAIDGSSRFGKNIPGAMTISGNKFAVMPSIAAAWLVSSEKFMDGKTFDMLKIRASYGRTGNDDIGNYTSRTTYVSQNLLGVQGLVRGGFGNSQLQWEEVNKINAGVDASLFNERVSLTVDVFSNKTKKMIVYEPAPVASGFDYAITNSGAMSSKGFEVSANGRIINKEALKWDVGFSIGQYKSTIDKLPVDKILTSFSGATYVTGVGGAPNLFYGYKTNGVYASDNEATQAGLSVRRQDGSLAPFTGGDVRFADVNGDDIIDENDRQVIGNPNPDFFGGVTSKLEYKRFSLDALFTFVQGNDIYNYTRSQLESMSGYGNQTEAVINRWRTNGHQTSIPKASWGDPMGNSRFSDRWIEDGSYFRMRTITLSYNIPMNTQILKYLVVYLTGNNVFTLTKYKGYDPEFSATESVFGQGVDNTLEPLTRSVLFGVRVGL